MRLHGPGPRGPGMVGWEQGVRTPGGPSDAREAAIRGGVPVRWFPPVDTEDRARTEGWSERVWAWWYQVRDALRARLAGIEGGREW